MSQPSKRIVLAASEVCPYGVRLHFAKHTKYASKHAKVNEVHPNMALDEFGPV
ncbi:MAG: hypothetical protein WBD56_16970 [Anaerolineales bacterium]